MRATIGWRRFRGRSRRTLAGLIGLGVLGLLGSAGTFAAFTASTFNPNNTFTAGSLLLTDTTGFTSARTTLSNGTGAGAPNLTGTDPRTLSECSTAIIAQQCSTVLKSTNVASMGIEPGQYVRGTITVTNAGSLPETVALQIQDVKTNNGNNSLYGSGAGGTSSCPSDVAGVTSAGSSGAQLTSGTTVSGYQSTPAAITGCLDIGRALRITIQDAGSGSTGPQCLFGNDVGAGSSGNDNLQAPISGGFSTGGTGLTTYTATGTKVGSGSGTCDDLSQSSLLGKASSPVLPGSNPKDLFGTQTSAAGNSSFAGLSGTSSFIFVPGAGSTFSLINSVTFGGNLTGMPQWAVGESHTFIITIALPDTGRTQLTDHNSDRYYVSNDNPYQGGAVSFDVYWFAIQ